MYLIWISNTKTIEKINNFLYTFWIVSFRFYQMRVWIFLRFLSLWWLCRSNAKYYSCWYIYLRLNFHLWKYKYRIINKKAHLKIFLFFVFRELYSILFLSLLKFFILKKLQIKFLIWKFVMYVWHTSSYLDKDLKICQGIWVESAVRH